MPRLRQVSKADASPEVNVMYERMFEDRDPVAEPGTATGTPGHWWTVFALVPDIFEHATSGFALFNAPERTLEPRYRELGLTRAGFGRGSQFVFSQHCKAARSVGISEEQVATVREAMPELPDQKRARYAEEYELSGYDARLLTGSRELAEFFERAVALGGPAKSVANWILRDLLQALKERDAELTEVAITPEILSALVLLVDGGRLTARSARDLFPELVASGGDPEALMQERGLEAVSDAGELEAAVDDAISSNAKVAESYHAGDAKALNFLMGQVMKRTQGRANPASARELLAKKLDS